MSSSANISASNQDQLHVSSNSQSQSLNNGTNTKRGWRFWCILLSLCISSFAAALELGSMSTALPNIVKDLQGEQFVWIGSAYALAATAFMPLSGGLAQIFGRRSIMLGALAIFALGSGLCGGAHSMNFLIAGRTVQGMGGGGIISITQIILADLVSLRERGTFNGLIAIWWGLGSGIGPIIGGSLAQGGQWRWLFYLNLPICAIAASLVFVFLRLPTPPGTLKEKVLSIDYIGNVLVIASTTSVVIALTWAGIQHPWNSTEALVPLILGCIGLCVFFLYEARWAKHPMIPFLVLSNRTGLSGYLQNFLTSFLVMAYNFYGPVYFQAAKDASPVASGVDIFGMALTISPVAFIAGIVIQKTNKYRPQIWVGWSLIIIGSGLMSTCHADTSRAKVIGYEIIGGAGLGVLYIAAYFPVLAPLPITKNAQALSVYFFLRNFALVWGVTIGGTILQNELLKRLPSEFSAKFPEGTEIAYSIIPLIPSLQQPLKDEVRNAFADSLIVLWQVLTGVGCLGLLCSLPMKQLQLHTSVDKDWGLEPSVPSTGEEKL